MFTIYIYIIVTIFHVRLALTVVTHDCLVYEALAGHMSRPDLHMDRCQVFYLIAQTHILWLSEQETTQTRWFLKTGFSVSVFILAQSVIADRWMTSQLKWDSGLGAGNRLFLCHNDTVPYARKISGSVADLTGITKRKKKKRAEIPFFRDRCTL